MPRKQESPTSKSRGNPRLRKGEEPAHLRAARERAKAATGKRTTAPGKEQKAKPQVPPPGTPPLPPPDLGDGVLPNGGRTRTRGEIRVECARVFDTKSRKRLEEALDDKDTGIKDVIAISELYARIGVGFIGAHEMDPADVAKLPAPVFRTEDPNAPLPDGKPD